LLASVGARYDVVLILAPPVLEVADALILGGQAGMLFLVARAGVTAQGELNESIRRLNQAGIAPHGVLFNGAPSER
jgi:tyrosine-protein kinase Etk/Wzc